jgi:alpha-ketoglutarate-dependent taurine dioxygenase
MADLKIRDLCREFGAEVTGLDPTTPLTPQVASQLRDLFKQRGMLVFPDLRPDARFQTWLAEQMVSEEPVDPAQLHVDELHQVSNVEKIAAVPLGRIMFHSDTMWEEDGCKAISLYGKVVSPGAIPTMFVSIANAWRTLPADLKARVEGRYAIHCPDATDQRKTYISDDVMVVDFGSKQQLRLPIAYTHPRTGETLLYVSPQLTHHIEGMDPEESEELLNALFDHMYAPQNIFTYHWREGDLLVWDNLTMQHARADLRADEAPRTLRKTLVPAYMVAEAQTGTFKASYRRYGD